MAAPAPPPPGGGGFPLVAVSSSAAAAALPRRFGMEDFLWGSTLGEGSYARVVHAQLKSNGRHYAIKVRKAWLKSWCDWLVGYQASGMVVNDDGLLASCWHSCTHHPPTRAPTTTYATYR